MHTYPALTRELHLENNIYINNVSSMKKKKRIYLIYLK